MARIRVLLVLSIVLAYFSYPLDRHALAEEYEEDLGVSQLKNKAKVINLSDVSKIDLSKINKIALSITSTSPLFGDVAEDQFSVKLRNKGFKLVELSKISDLTLREARKKELERLKEQLEIESNWIRSESSRRNKKGSSYLKSSWRKQPTNCEKRSATRSTWPKNWGWMRF